MEYRKGDKILVIEQDLNPIDPREWDNMGTMICFHRRYDLGDKHDYKSSDFNGWEEVEEHLYKEEDAIVVLPLYLYDHSGLRMKVGSFNGLLPQGHARFDSGQVGFIYATKDALIGWDREHKDKYYPEKTDEQIIQKVLISEIETYDQYLSGDIHGFTLYEVTTCDLGHEHREHIDSCWGFYDRKSLLEHAGIDDLEEWEEAQWPT